MSDEGRQESGADDGPRDGESDWEARRGDLKQRLDAKRAALQGTRDGQQTRRGGLQGAAQGLKIASEFIAGILVGAAIGYAADWLFGIRPFGLIAFLLLGFVAGILNVLRGISHMPGDR